MKFKLPRHKISSHLKLFISKKFSRRKIGADVATQQQLEQIAAVAKQIEKEGLPSHFVLKKLKGKLGHGIFLHPQAQPILKGTVIAPYSGKVVLAPKNGDSDSDYIFSIANDIRLTKEEQKIFDAKNKFHPRRLYALDLDAEKTGNFTRFINHSAHPNIEAHLVALPAHFSGHSLVSYEIIYIASETIEPGDQLLVCYEGEDESYWGALNIVPTPITPKTFQLKPNLDFFV